MVKIFTVEQIRKADQYTIDHEPINSLELMERAAGAATQWITEHYQKEQPISIFCGIGNNGGDGLVMARLLHEKAYDVEVFIVQLSENYSEDFTKNLERLPIEPNYLNEEDQDFQIQEGRILIDAIFGTGLSRPIEGFAADVVEIMNASQAELIAIDIPSGLYAEDNPEDKDWLACRAKHTLSFQFPKLSMLFPQNARFVGDFQLIDIGLHPDYIESTDTPYYLFTLNDAISTLKKRTAFSHKGDHGRALLMSGSKGKMGAAVLAAKASLRSGVGLLSLQIPKLGYDILQSQVPEAMVEVDEGEDYLSELKGDLRFDALGIGPGIGIKEETQKLLKMMIQQCSGPMVIDADALNILSENKTWLSFLPKGSILTPHPGEFKRLAEEWSSDYERLQRLRDFSKKYSQYVILKGKFSAIACPDGRVYFNTSGNAGMATGGSGDALTGILTALLAQGYPSEQAAVLGAFVHGLAGDLAAQDKGEISMLPSDLIEKLPKAFKMLK